jgi:hypothetical protein
MKYIIHYSDIDSVVIEGEEIEDCQRAAKEEVEKRGWPEIDCWSEKVES